MTKKESIADIVKAAPRPNELAEALLMHLQGEGQKKFSRTVFYNPVGEEYDAYGYVCFLLGLDIESDVDESNGVTNTGYCVAPDGSKELVTRVGNTVLGYLPTQSSTPLPSGHAGDWTHLWSSMNTELNEDGEVDETNVSELEAEIFHREIPLDLAREIQIIANGDRDPLTYERFTPMIRKPQLGGKPYALPDQQPD